MMDEEAVYIKRYKALDQAAKVGGGLPSYDPLERVAGAWSTGARREGTYTAMYTSKSLPQRSVR